MATRKGLSKKIRFEVFKRDSFKCQYCGRSSPDVILEVDHIVPVSEGGKNDLLNLITSCRDCNRGKTNKLLSDTSVIDKQKKQLDDLNAIREQTEMLIQWKQECMNAIQAQVDAIESLMYQLGNAGLTENGRRETVKLIHRFGFSEVYDATEIAYSKYDKPNYAFSKIGGICYNRAKQREGGNSAK